MKSMMVASVLFATVAAFAQNDAVKDGGIVRVAGKGCLAIADCRSGMDWQKVEPAIARFKESFHIEVKRVNVDKFTIETAASLVEQIGVNAVLFVCDIKGYPPSLMAAEQKWAFVNLAPLKADGGNYEKRCQYLLLRGIYRALGSDVSRAGETCLAPVYKLSDLDKITGFDVAMDTYIAVNAACESLGIEPTEYLTFREACELENPPMPTNDVQRAIAAEVKAAKQKK